MFERCPCVIFLARRMLTAQQAFLLLTRAGFIGELPRVSYVAKSVTALGSDRPSPTIAFPFVPSMQRHFFLLLDPSVVSPTPASVWC